MSNTALTHGLSGLASDSTSHGLSNLLAWPARIARWIANEHHYNRDMAELHQLDDRVLRDIGIDRSEIGSVVRHGRGR